MHHGPLGAVLDAGCVPSSQSQGVHIFAFTSHLYQCTHSSSSNLFFSLGFVKITALPEINPSAHYTWGQIRIHCWVPRSPRRPSPSLPIGLQSLQERLCFFSIPGLWGRSSFSLDYHATPPHPLSHSVSAPFQLVRQLLLEYLGQQKTPPSITASSFPS